MQPLMIVVRQVASKDSAELSDVRKRSAVCHLGFQRVKERFHVGVLIGRAPTRHALRDAALDQAIAERRAQKLTAAVTVKDEAGPRLPPMELLYRGRFPVGCSGLLGGGSSARLAL